jgi:flagellar protein FlgJ
MIEMNRIQDSYGINRNQADENKLRDAERKGESFGAILKERMDRAEDGSPDAREAASYKRKKVEDKKLMDVCIQMESLFVSKMLKEMRSTVHKGDFINGGFAEEIFEDMLYDEYALSISKNSKLGLAKMIYDDLSRKMGPAR